MITDTGSAFWDKSAEKYAQDKIADEAAYQATLKRIQAYLRPEDHVLEIGAGTSATAVLLAPGVEDYLATDYSAGMVKIGRRRALEAGSKNLTTEQAGIETAPERSDGYDAVLALNLLHLVPDLAPSLAHISARVAPSGLFISKTSCLSESAFAMRVIFRIMVPLLRLFGKAPQQVFFLSTARLDHAIEASGFEIVETLQDTGIGHRRFVVARKP